MDGKVVRGKSSVDECMLTGESMPVLKASGSLVTGGTVNCEAPLLVEATADGATGQLADIKRLVEDAQARQVRSLLCRLCLCIVSMNFCDETKRSCA